MEIEDFKKLLKKHKVMLALMKEPHYLQKQDKEVREAYEQIIAEYPVNLIETRETITAANRRDIIIRDLLAKLRAK